VNEKNRKIWPRISRHGRNFRFKLNGGWNSGAMGERRISTASGSERGPRQSPTPGTTLATARGTDNEKGESGHDLQDEWIESLAANYYRHDA